MSAGRRWRPVAAGALLVLLAAVVGAIYAGLSHATRLSAFGNGKGPLDRSALTGHCCPKRP
jgi:hypothetical protein